MLQREGWLEGGYSCLGNNSILSHTPILIHNSPHPNLESLEPVNMVTVYFPEVHVLSRVARMVLWEVVEPLRSGPSWEVLRSLVPWLWEIHNALVPSSTLLPHCTHWLDVPPQPQSNGDLQIYRKWICSRLTATVFALWWAPYFQRPFGSFRELKEFCQRTEAIQHCPKMTLELATLCSLSLSVEKKPLPYNFNALYVTGEKRL